VKSDSPLQMLQDASRKKEDMVAGYEWMDAH